MTQFTNNFSEEVWYQKYKFGQDQSINDTFDRVAKDLASVEQDKKYWKKQFRSLLEDFKFIPGGRILSNAGTGLQGTTYINCFVDGFLGEDKDSIKGIYDALTRQALTLKSEGGYGFCCSTMRPRGSHIGGIGNQTPGAVKFLELWNVSSEIITSGSGFKSSKKEKNFIRKGAQMVTMHCWHPDIEEFITIKQDKEKLKKFNMSVLCTDKFIESVIQNKNWDLIFPDIENFKKEYKKDWDGNIDKWIIKYSSKSVKVYKTIKARDLWNLLMESTFNRNEPGVLFIDTINKMNNLWYCENIDASNPCGEQILPKGGVCLLGSINLTQFVNVEQQNWDYNKLEKLIPNIIRFMDNVNDKTKVPLSHQKENLRDKRRIGIGYVGYHSALMMMKIKYGSNKALELTEELCDFVKNQLYQKSALLAKEKGHFPLFDKEKYLSGNFIKTLSNTTINLIKKHGIRNSHLLSVQPTGNTAVLGNILSGGLEPIFAIEYYRTSIQSSIPEGLYIPKNIDWQKLTFQGTDWKWIKEGDTDLLAITFDDKIWKYDKDRGLLKEELVQDFGVRFLKENNQFDSDKEWCLCAHDLSIKDHVKTMSIFAKNCDSAISKTLNFPNNYPYTDFKKVYIEAWKNGIKGFTTYREGTMSHVLSKKSSMNDIVIDRPNELQCRVYHTSVKGQPYFVFVGLMEDHPYEVFAGKNEDLIDHKVKEGRIIKMKRPKSYKAILDDETELSPITAVCSDSEESLTRMISLAIRCGSNIERICTQLLKTKGEMTSFAKAIARCLKNYIDNNTISDEKCLDCNINLIYSESCLSCPNCGNSRCN